MPDRCHFLMPANYGMLLMRRDREQFTALHLAATPVSGFMSNGNYCALMALIHGVTPPLAQFRSLYNQVS